ncbi:type II secretion system F family protein [Butyrivibrio proteoclasticus]|nr:type II secretion system F family protein [Butyrivibrio proteoclasticus]
MAKEMTLPAGINEEGISREFLKIALFIYEKLCSKKRPIEEGRIRGYLAALHNRKDIEQMETEYFIRKISIVLVIVLAGCFLAAAMFISSRNSKFLEGGNIIHRKNYGEGEFEAGLLAKSETGEEIGEYDFLVNERLYSAVEANELFERASKEAEQLILKDNPTFGEIRDDINLIDNVPGYPFQISWKLDDYELMHSDGRLETDKIPKEGVLLNATAIYKYNEQTWKQEFVMNLLPKALSPKERLAKSLGDLLKEADGKTTYDETIELPKDIEGEAIVWSEQVEDNSILILVLTIVGACMCYIAKDEELKSEMEKRNLQMLADYPQLVSQLVLYLGAGMTVRNIFEKLGKNYIKSREKGDEKHFVYEELVRACRELASGISEIEAYERFGSRCSSQQYSRLSTLLAQNLRKGNGELLKVLNDESKNAFNERMDKVRKLGEEAGTKLLLPMILMLLVVMVMIMIPAYMAF